MKKILLAATLLVALTSAAFADGKNSNAKLLNDLKTAFKGSNQSAWQTTESYKKASFTFNGTSVRAYFDIETEDLIGFGISVNVNDLPQGTAENISRKYQGWEISAAIMFIDATGRSTYYAQVDKNGHSLALRVSDKGKVSVYAKMPN
jgi:opacity protein-like surface antigen